jgi:hypothetical protein
MNLTWNELKELADAGSIQTSVSLDSGIVGVKFKTNGIPFTCQFSTTNKGIYAFALDYSADIKRTLTILANAEPELITGETE